ncbi:O-antigen ligase family protein [Candidatus Wolfebacteria bacterium]|nr:O-antigen ligase family protein [Candidatus Wolfebacteria bacterium]
MFEQKIINTIKYLVYGLVVSVPLVYFPTMMMPFQLSKTVVFQILAEIIFALWLGLAIFNKKYRPNFTPLTIILSVFIIIISLSAIFGSDWRVSLWSDEQRSLGLAALWHFFALFLALSSLKEKIDWNRIWILSFWTAVAVSLIGISQKFIVFPKDANPWLHIVYSGIPDRIGSTFSNSAFMAGYLLFNFFIGIYLFTSRKTRVNADWFLPAGILLISIAIFLSQTLGVMTGLFAGILFLLIYFAVNPVRNSGFNFRKASAVLLILLVLFAGLLTATKNSSFWQKVPGLKRVANFSLQEESVNGRLITWRLSWNAFKEKPIFGWGFENFRIPFDRHYDPRLLTNNLRGTYWDKPHNIILEYLTTTGVVGLLAYLGIFFAAFYVLIKNKKISANFCEFPLISALLISYFVQNLFIFDTIGAYLMFFLVLAFINSYSINKLLSSYNNPITNNSITDSYSTVKQKFAFGILLAVSLVPVYYNYQIFKGANGEYWGVNYFLNRLTESSFVSFNQALTTSTPYIDDIRKSFANIVKQAYQQGINYPNLNDLQDKMANHLRLVIKRHPQGFLNYITLAEFENVFYQFNPDYMRESEELALKALELSPERQQIYYVLAKVKLLKGDVAGAYKVFEDVVSLNPEAADPHLYFGLMAYGIGDVKRGNQEIARAEQLGRTPQKVEELINLGNFVGDLEHNYKKSVEYYKLALSVISGEAGYPARRQEILLKLAIAYYFDKNYEQSRQTFLELKKAVDLKLSPIYPDLQPVLRELGIE